MRKIIGISFGIIMACSYSVAAQDSLDFNQKVEVRKVLNNSSDKASFTAYKYFKTRSLSSLSKFKSKPIRTDKYGGRMDKKEHATGFYYTKKIADRWWAIDPQGHLFIHNALNAVSMGSSDRNKDAFTKLYGNENQWITKTQDFLIENGFNGTGAWSNTKAIQNSPLQQTKPLAYTINLDFMSAYGDKRGGTYVVPGHKGYPNNVIFVFDPAFETFCDEAAKKLVANQNDANLFGYFSDNEMPLGIKNLDGYLTLKDQQDPGYLVAKKFIDNKGVAADKITDVDRREFLSIVADKYFSIVSKAIKKYDPNHMYLGCRFHGQQGFIAELWKSAGKYLDAISMNYYNAWTPDQALMANWTAWSGKPFIITEWYVKGDDSELGNTAGAGWVVKTQSDRGLFYQNFTLGLIESKNCIGWHWFKYMDNDPLQKGAEPSNTNANKGVIDNNYQVYQPLLEKMKALNFQMYQLADFFDQKK
ncbi:agarase [Pedobacter boryungensis]|uniref:Agarase n=1 Tax=Pedobacter boryungensis TaxID=869962 RepID=A0ABX2D9E4_9SPHI|nr:agarase [Pedobacter boryungensis]NQX30600.1 agarase [Pedobacter boryungensis]